MLWNRILFWLDPNGDLWRPGKKTPKKKNLEMKRFELGALARGLELEALFDQNLLGFSSLNFISAIICDFIRIRILQEAWIWIRISRKPWSGSIFFRQPGSGSEFSRKHGSGTGFSRKARSGSGFSRKAGSGSGFSRKPGSGSKSSTPPKIGMCNFCITTLRSFIVIFYNSCSNKTNV